MTYTPLAPEVQFNAISVKYARVRIFSRILWWGLLAIGLALCAGLWWKVAWTWIFPALALAAGVWHCALAGCQARAIGYFETPEELLICRGIMFRNLAVIPYGRMQTVTVASGPVEERLGLASVTLETASAGSMGEIPGLPSEEAERLRAKLTSMAQAGLEGI